MVNFASLILLVLPILSTRPVLSRPGDFNKVRQNVSLLYDTPCGAFGGHGSLCQHCLHHNIRDLPQCMWSALESDPASAFMADFSGIPSLHFIREGTTYNLSMSMQQCKRPRWNERVGPFNTRNEQNPDAAIKDIVMQLSNQPNVKDAMDIVRSNTAQGVNEVRSLLGLVYHPKSLSVQNRTVFGEIEAHWRSAGIKLIDGLISRAVGGTTVWFVTSALAQVISGPDPTPIRDISNGATATLVLLTYLAIIDWLEKELVYDLLLLDFIKWILWVVQVAVSTMRRVVQRITRRPPRLDYVGILSTIRTPDEAWIERNGPTTSFITEFGGPPPLCDEV